MGEVGFDGGPARCSLGARQGDDVVVGAAGEQDGEQARVLALQGRGERLAFRAGQDRGMPVGQEGAGGVGRADERQTTAPT
ncbi:hypothetical protein ACFYN3_40695 [Streptomyces lavendulae]|uniref:hypothetical protein n=1 Tax=Streptomyces lavendulae TaxID=1914 RepID=UPI0036842392